tara:strand:+ start:98 stop:295 length:198 start_codon:yes stop_codon:yes gene_type:complete
MKDRLDRKIKFYKPNIFKRFMYWLGIMEEKYDGKKFNYMFQDEIGHWKSPDVVSRWDKIKKAVRK